MSVFFVTGLPRSRTAWCANFLTNGNSLCLHAALLECGGSVDTMVTLIEGLLKFYEHVGVSDPSLLPAPMFERTVQLLPVAKWVFIEQDPVASQRKHNAAFPELAMPLELFSELRIRMHEISRGLPCLGLQLHDLDNPSSADELHRYVLGREMDYVRWEMLNKMSISANRSKWLAAMDLETRGKVEALRR